MPDLRHRTARHIAAVSDSCPMTLLMLPIVLAHALINLPWTLYQAIITRRHRTQHTGCPGCPACEILVAVRLPKDLHQ